MLPSSKGRKDYLQFEVHYLDTNDKSHVTVLCNQSRILLMFDFLLDTWNFLSRKEENEFKGKTFGVYLMKFYLITGLQLSRGFFQVKTSEII